MPFRMYLSPLLWDQDFLRGFTTKVYIWLMSMFFVVAGWWWMTFLFVTPFFFVDIDLQYRVGMKRSVADYQLEEDET